MLRFIIALIEARFPGSKPIIDNALAVLKSEHEVIAALLTTLERYVPDSGVTFLEMLRSAMESLIALQMAKVESPSLE